MVFKASKIKRIIFLSGIFVFLVIFICFLALNHLEKLKFDFKKETKIKLPTVETNSKEEFPNQKKLLPETFELDIPFIVQAPLGNWSPPFDHACEEASVLMVHYYFEKKQPQDPKKLAKEIFNLVSFEKKKYGVYKDTSAKQTAQLIKDYFGYEVKVFYDISLEDIKKELVKGNPVILPVLGRNLKNPFYTPPGPKYHMLVVKGYNKEGFITNDPGTKRGENFFYPFEILEKAIQDYGEDTKEKKRAMIVIFPPK
jgi:uncharacterized protein YvpB